MLKKIEAHWDNILNNMKEEHEITDIAFNTWIKPLVPALFENNKLFVTFEHDGISEDYLNRKFQLPLKFSLSSEFDKDMDVIIIKKDKLFNEHSSEEVKKTEDPDITNETLNSKYTFETFVVGKNSDLAHASALAVAEDPGTYGNPLFIYGGVGLGKTHLMQAVAHYALKQQKDFNILYVTSEEFTNELIFSIRNHTTEAFKKKYRNVNMLLIDDIQFLVGRESTQEEFFHTFNSLYDKKRQIIISSDRPPKDLEGIEDRLVSRFKAGLTVDIKPPSFETRVAILSKKAESDNINIDEECLSYIGENISSNIRELEGALNQLNNYVKLNNIKEIDLDVVKRALQTIIAAEDNNPVTLDSILSIVADHFNIEEDILKGKKRTAEIANTRQVFMYLANHLTDNSLASIGQFLGGKDHTTISYGVEQIYNKLKNDDSLKNTIEILIKKINPQ